MHSVHVGTCVILQYTAADINYLLQWSKSFILQLIAFKQNNIPSLKYPFIINQLQCRVTWTPKRFDYTLSAVNVGSKQASSQWLINIYIQAHIAIVKYTWKLFIVYSNKLLLHSQLATYPCTVKLIPHLHQKPF